MIKVPMVIDVREDLRSGREPFVRIMFALSKLAADEDLLLVAPFEPLPLYTVLERQGFGHAARMIGPDHWEVLFQRSGVKLALNEKTVTACGCGCPSNAGLKVVDLDARGLEPPQPMVAILEALTKLPEGAELRAKTDRRPVHLYAQLEERGFNGQTEESQNGYYITSIRRN